MEAIIAIKDKFRPAWARWLTNPTNIYALVTNGLTDIKISDVSSCYLYLSI